jgi:hypothetical protein
VCLLGIKKDRIRFLTFTLLCRCRKKTPAHVCISSTVWISTGVLNGLAPPAVAAAGRENPGLYSNANVCTLIFWPASTAIKSRLRISAAPALMPPPHSPLAKIRAGVIGCGATSKIGNHQSVSAPWATAASSSGAKSVTNAATRRSPPSAPITCNAQLVQATHSPRACAHLGVVPASLDDEAMTIGIHQFRYSKPPERP